MQIIYSHQAEFRDYWACLLAVDSLSSTALYGERSLAFYEDYSGAKEVADHSFVAVEGRAVIAGIRLFSFTRPNGGREFSCFGLPSLFLQNRQLGAALLNRCEKSVKDVFRGIVANVEEDARLIFRDSIDQSVLALPSKLLLELGASFTAGFTQVIDLSVSDEILHQGMTKSFKWGVNWGNKHLDIRVLDRSTITSEAMESFRALHFEAAGRATRSDRSWKIQMEMVKGGEAFCVFGFQDGILVSAALFHYSPIHCFYGVSASKRELFDKPISHALIWRAIVYARSLGVRYFEMGQQVFPGSMPSPSKKELGISFFKRAFGGQTKAYLDFVWERGAWSQLAN